MELTPQNEMRHSLSCFGFIRSNYREDRSVPEEVVSIIIDFSKRAVPLRIWAVPLRVQRTAPFLSEFSRGRQLGEPGQFGVTHSCTELKTKCKLAVKQLNKNRFYRVPQKQRERYLRAMHDEIDIMTTLIFKHPNIIALHSVYEDKQTMHLVMEQCTGGELFHRISKKGSLSEPEAAGIMKQLLSAVDYLHSEHQIVHCDLEPANILSESRDSDLIKVIDFGMSKVLPRLEYLTQLCSKPYYTAPEVICAKKYTHLCDVWSVGVILFVRTIQVQKAVIENRLTK